MENPVNYNDLFSPTLQGDIDGLITKVKEVETTLTNMIATLTPKAQELANALSGSNSATSAGRSATKTAAAEVQQLYAVYEQLGLGVDYVQKNLASLIATQTAHNKATKDAEIVNKSNVDSITRLKAQIDLAKIALEGMSETQRKNSIEGQTLTNIIKTLGGQVKGYTDSIKGMASVSSAAASASASQQQGVYDLATSYSSLSTLMQQTGVNIETLITTQKQAEIAAKNGQVANTSLSGSYNQLAAQYNLIKLALNSMSAEMRNSTTGGKVWEAQALSLMNTMKGMQEATGKHTLSVGDYTKAFNGLSISTQQVLRELPTLANSWSQFFIAISNNVPIFVDNLKQVQQETGSWTVAMKGVLTSVFSWQTALLVVLTILPKIAKAIHDKKKAQDEDNDTTKKQIEYLHLVHEALLASAKAETENISKLRTLVAIINDHNRAEQDRINAAQVLKKTYDEQLGNYTAEEIALGKAKTSLDEITKSLVEQAEARALLNKITEAYAGQIDAEDKMITAGQTKVYEYGFQNVKGLYDYVQNLLKTTKLSEEHIKKSIAFVAKEDEGVWEQYEAYKAARKEMQEYGKTIEDLRKRIPVAGLLESMDVSGNTKEQLDKSKDYYWQWRESVANIMEDEEERALELNNIKYEHAIANMQKELEERKAAGNLTIEQEKYMTDIITNLETERQQKRWEIIWDFYEKYWNSIKDKYQEKVKEEVIDEEDLSISGRYEKILAENAKNIMASREKFNTALEQGSYREAKEEGKAFKDLTIEKLKLEEELQEALLKMRLETGNITADQYEIELANLQTTLAKNIANLSKKRKGKFDIATLLFGELKEDGNGNVFKELSSEAQAFVSTFTSSMQMAFDYMDEWMDKRIEMAQVAVDAAQKETDSAKSALDAEIEAKANGYANNVELARKEYAAKLKLQKDAVAEQKRLQKIQEAVDTAQQISSLVTATAELWKAHAGIPGAGPALAIAATALMWGSFLAAKIQAVQLANAKTTYGEGMTEYVNYGGSHASGNDVDFGRDKNGRQRTVERGEVIGVINKKNVSKYGVNKVMDIVASINNGTFDKKYSDAEKVASTIDIINAFSGSSGRANTISTANELTKIFNNSSSVLTDALPKGFGERAMEANYGMAFSGLSGDKTDLSLVEQGIRSLIEQGETKIVQTEDGRIEYKGNNKRIIHN